jgi:hypothetical protein
MNDENVSLKEAVIICLAVWIALTVLSAVYG